MLDRLLRNAAGLTLPVLALLAVALPALAQDGGAPLPCQLTPLAIKPGDCAWGAPLQSGPQWLLPKVCRVALPASGGKPAQVMIRHGVEVVGTGRNLYLPATPWTQAADAPLPAPGEWLAGEPPLLVLPEGLAVFDLRSNRAEWVLEADGALAAVARDGDVIALADRIAAAGKQPALVEFSAVDIGKGLDFGAVVTKDSPVLDLAVVRTDRALSMHATLETPKGRALAQIALTDATGKQTAKDGQLPLQASAAPAKAESPRHTVSDNICPQFGPRRLVLPASPALVVRSAGVSADRRWSEPTTLPNQTPVHCAALLLGSTPQTRFVWMWGGESKAPLAAELTCRQ